MSGHRHPLRAAISRRRFLSGAGLLPVAGLSLPALIAGCGEDSASTRRGGSKPVLYVESWPVYIDPTEDGHLGTVDRFRQATGIDLRYTESINDNDEYFAKIQPILGAGKAIDPDLFVISNWMAARLIHLGWLDPLPLDRVPNRVNLMDDLVKPSWDPSGEYTLPWQTVLTGIAYNRDVTGRDLTSVQDLLDPTLAGRVAMVTEMRDTIGLLLLGLGIDPSKITTLEEAAPAFDQLERAKDDGQIRAFTGNDYLDDLSTGNFAACMAWSGDVLQLAKDNPSVRFVVPDEGAIFSPDTLVMPRGASNREAAARYLDFVYDPVEAARIATWVQFITPVKGAQEEVAKNDPELAAAPLLFPDAATRARFHEFATLSEDVEEQFDEAFSRIIGA